MNTEQGAAAVLPLPALLHVARIVPQHALQLIGGQPGRHPWRRLRAGGTCARPRAMEAVWAAVGALVANVAVA